MGYVVCSGLSADDTAAIILYPLRGYVPVDPQMILRLLLFIPSGDFNYEGKPGGLKE